MISNRWPYATRPVGLRSLSYKQPSPETRSLLIHLMDRHCAIDFDDAKQLILQNPVSLAIIRNNGQHTYLVHSTTLQNAKKAAAEGFIFHGAFMQPEKPDLQSSVMMLAGPQEKNRKDLNIFGLMYRYTGSDRSQLHQNNAKVVIELPLPYPGTIYDQNPFENTKLNEADGTMIIEESTLDTGQYRIPAQYVKGYFLQDEGTFVPNPKYGAANT